MAKWSLIFLSSLHLVQAVVAGARDRSTYLQVRSTRRAVNVQTKKDLAGILSCQSVITEPTDTTWHDRERYMQNVVPEVQLSVRPGREDDVSKIVQYANSHNISFYAVSRGHALTTSVGRFKGIEIDLGGLNRIHINTNNETARFQGGVFSHEVIGYLWDHGFVTATGGCSCVSVLGPALGGGHGLQQGKHGLTSDHFVNLNVVLANGTSVQVNMESNPDLWWAMRGAGHNFGIVTSFESKIWPEGSKQYYVKTYQFGGDVLEALIEQVNQFQGNGTLDPTWLASFGLYTMNTTLNDSKATILWTFLYDGRKEDASAALKPFDELDPLSVDDLYVPYKTINDQVGGAIDGWLCEGNKTHIIGTAGLEVYNVTTMRAIYELYNEKISQYPELGHTRVLVEGYAVKGVHSFKSEDSAYALRGDNILTYFDTRFDTTDDPLIPVARKWRDQTVDLWNAGQPLRRPTTYVNYAAGYEPAEAMYGYEPWRLEKLQSLKHKYDPLNKFAWYNPIIPPTGA